MGGVRTVYCVRTALAVDERFGGVRTVCCVRTARGVYERRGVCTNGAGCVYERRGVCVRTSRGVCTNGAGCVRTARGVCTNGLPAGWPQGCTCLPAISRARGVEPGTARPGIGKFDWPIRCCVHLKQALCVCLSVTLLCLQGLVGSFSFVSSCLFQFQWKIKAVKCLRLHITFSVFFAILCRVARMDR